MGRRALRGPAVDVRVAAVDCGTNSLRLLVADAEGGQLREIVRVMRIVRLGEGVDRTGRLADDALRRARSACQEYRGMIDAHGVTAIRFVATSAARDATNSDEFVADVTRVMRVDPEILTGEEEAALTFTGAVRGETVATPALVFDIGGGSTEFVRGVDGPSGFASVDMGCVRFTERYVGSDRVSDDEAAAIVAEVGRKLDEVEATVPLVGARTLVGCAGTVTTVAALALGLPGYDSARIHGARISAGDVARVTRELVVMTARQRAELPVMHPGRADVISAGCLILRSIVERCGATELVASERDILDGIAWSLA